MAKHLRTITEDKRLEGVKKSKIEDGQVYGGKDASVQTNDPATVEFAKKHKVEKHDDRAGNGPEVYSGGKQKPALDDKRNAKMKPDEKMYEAADVTPSQKDSVIRSKSISRGNDGSVSLNKSTSITPGGSTSGGTTISKNISSTPAGTGVERIKSNVTVTKTKQNESAECMHTEAGKPCPVHGEEACPNAGDDEPRHKGKKLLTDKNIKEGTLDNLKSAYGDVKSGKYGSAANKVGSEIIKAAISSKLPTPLSMAAKVFEPSPAMAGENEWQRQKTRKEEVELDEVLTKKTPVGKVISDFVHSKDPKFAGKSKKERQKMALGAYYGMHPEKSKNEAAVEPLLGEGGKPKKKKNCKESGPDTPIKPSGDVPSTTQNVKADTGYNI